MTLLVSFWVVLLGSYKRFLPQKFEGFTHIYKIKIYPIYITFCRYLRYNYSLLYVVLS